MGMERHEGKVRVNGTWFLHWHFASQNELPSVLTGDLDWTTSGWLNLDPSSSLAFQNQRKCAPMAFQMERVKGKGSGE